MSQEEGLILRPEEDALFARVAVILDGARQSVVRSVNSSMVLAYWLLGREIVETIQEGEERAAYGAQVLKGLSARLQAKYGRGFSVPNLENFRKFFLAYRQREPISSPPGKKCLPAGQAPQKSSPPGRISSTAPPDKERNPARSPFAPELTWSHYRALMRVNDERARSFYESEAIERGWSKAQLERQIQSSHYERILAHRGEEGLVAQDRERLPGEAVSAREVLRSPLVLEFLDLPDAAVLHESALEEAIIGNLQSFMLELGKGFAFVARQKHVRFDDDDFYIDLVFYNFLLKCFVLVDLKIGKLTHKDVGQMDGYVRLFEERFKVAGDNPTIGLILCSDKSEAVAKYSVLRESEQLFATKYLPFLPTEAELARELENERKLLEAKATDADV